MKIAVFGINYYPEVTGIGLYTTEMCEYLAGKGHEVRVITAYPYYPFGHDYASWYRTRPVGKFMPSCSEDIRGVSVRRCNLYKPSRPDTLARIFHELSFVFSVWVRTLFDFGKCDLVISVSPPLLLGFVARLYAGARKAPLVLHIQDMQPDAAIELGMIRNKAVISILLGLERRLYGKADHITTISETMRHKLIRKGVRHAKTGLLFNWADTSNIVPLPRKNSFSKQHGLDDKFVVLHAGNMGEKQDMRIILEAAAAISHDPAVVFVLAGRGARRRQVEHFMQKHDLRNVLLFEIQPKTAFNEMLASCDVALITQRKGVGDCVMPSKVFGPACAERPMIIASEEECEIARLAAAHRFGLVISPGHSEELVASIYRLKEGQGLAEELGRNARHFMVRERSMETILEKFEKELLARHDPGAGIRK